MVKLSVAIITFNEEKNIGRCLASLSGVADEIIVVDSNSTDNTAEIARSYGAKVILNSFVSYGQQKNLATDSAANDWVLSLDADEELAPEITKSILKVKEVQEYNVYEMARFTNYCGQWIKHSGWYPDKQTRLYNRTKGRWIEKKVHEYWALHEEGKKGMLKGDLLHYSYSSLEEHLTKIDRYSELSALDAVERGKKASILTIMFSPFWHFFNEYFIKLGFLDGFHGYTICKLSAYATFSKYTKIRMFNKLNR